MPAASKWIYLQEARGVAGLICGKQGGRLAWAAAAESRWHLLVSGHHFYCLLIVTMGCACTFWLRKTSVDTQAVFQVGWQNSLEASLPWHGCQDQGKECAAFPAHNVQPCAKSFRLLDLCWSHLLNGYHDNHTLIKRCWNLSRLPVWMNFVNCT